MFGALTKILAFAVLGDAIASGLNLSLPGSAIGLLLLTSYFVLRNGPDAGSLRLFESVSPHFALFFVPAAVGIVANFEILLRSWFFFVAAIVLGTTTTLVVTGYLAQRLLDESGRQRVHQPIVHQQEKLL